MNELYYKVKNNVIEEGPMPLPRSYKTNTGENITGFNLLENDALVSFGFYPAIIENPNEFQRQLLPVIENLTVFVHVKDIPLDEAKEILIQKVYSYARFLLDAETGKYAQGEMLYWGDLVKEAEEYEKNDAIGPFLQQRMDENLAGITEITASILAKNLALNDLRRIVIATRNIHKEAIGVLDFAGCVTYDVHADWPQ